MLFHNDSFIIHKDTFSLIQDLQSQEFLKDFYLVGGTALALQIGHRNSVDIDLFTQKDFSTEKLEEKVLKKFNYFKTNEDENTLMCIINNVKVDFLKHSQQFINQPITEEKITFLSKEDIAAMKLNAIAKSGQRLKDFIDLYYLLDFFSVKEMLNFYEIKYPNSNPLIPLKALTFFDDIDEKIDPPILRKKISLKKIKDKILKRI